MKSKVRSSTDVNPLTAILGNEASLFPRVAGKQQPLSALRRAAFTSGARRKKRILHPDPSTQPGLHLFTSNRLETLAARLAERLRAPLALPLRPETIVVRNKGMERWLKLELARRHGVCANCVFPFPEAFGHEAFAAVVPGLVTAPPLDREALGWRIMGALPALLDAPAFAPLRHYLHGESDPRKLIQLAGRIANLFDQYLVFRPALILEWDAGRDEQWQAILWRSVAADFREHHAAALRRRFAEIIHRDAAPAGLPERLSIFGVSALPPFHLDLFGGLARHLPVNLFLLQPSEKYWGDITSARESERLLRRQKLDATAAFQLHLETGNRLLASLGYLGRDFLKLLLDAGDWITDEAFIDPGEGSLLACLQSDLLHLRDRGHDDETPPLPIAPDDDSVQIHSCHSPLREMEVLHDQMLDWFQRDPTLAPRDLVVMTPDIETYAPFVQAVFGSPENPARAIAFSVADRGARRESHIIDTFLQLLDLPKSRLGAATVLALLETPAVRERFALRETDLPLLRTWVEETNIRWGIDAAHRGQLDLPKLAGNTWRDGLDRLLLGYSMAGGGERTFHGILPYDNIEGGAAIVLGHFVEFIERLIATLDTLQASHSLRDWAAALEQILESFFQSSESAEFEFQTLRGVFAGLRRQQELSGFVEAIPLAVLLERLAPALEEDLYNSGFLTGGVTFCGLKPMRSIPFKIVCLVGMDDSAFPRPVHHLSFDLMAKQPRLGDRSTREDDRYLFLETILSARAKLYLSYVGQSARDNSEAPPSVLVSELLDYLAQGFVLADGARVSPPAARTTTTDAPAAAGDTRAPNPTQALLHHVVTHHRLQAFSEEYFKPGARLFSYSRENSQASAATRQARQNPPSFITQPLGEADSEFRHVTLDDFAAFFANPAKFFLNRRLKIFLPDAAEELDESEPFVLNALESHQLKQTLLQRKLAQLELEPARALASAAGSLPLGTVGATDYRRTCARVEKFFERLHPRLPSPPPAPIDLQLTLGSFQLTGRIVEQTSAGPLLYRCARTKARDVLRAALLHLAANVAQPGRTTTLLGEDGVRVYAPPTDAAASLQDLLEIYWEGLRAPLKFFPQSALAFAEATEKARSAKPGKRPSRPPLDKARDQWEGNALLSIPGEKENPHFDLCFRHEEPLDENFERLASRVFDPVLKLETKEEA